MKNDPQEIKKFLLQKQQQALYRSVKISVSAQQPRMTIDHHCYLTFCSNDYLGLASHPDVIAAFQRASNTYGVGSGAAHLINGHSIEHQLLEEELAAFTGRDRALLFSTGYMANIGVINALLERDDKLFADRLNHASLVDAGLLSRARMKRYAHKDTQHLNKLYETSRGKNSLIASDGVFSMDGDIAPVFQLAKIAARQNAWLMIDDAHGFGVLGENGAGLLEQEELDQNQVPILMATLGKAIGTAGAFVAGSSDLIDYLIQTARTYIYTTAMPPAIAAATRVSIEITKNDSWRREKLAHLIKRFKQGAQQIDLNLMPSDSAIQPVLIGQAQTALEISRQLQQRGILVSAIRTPTVPEGTARLRITFSASHSEQDVDILLDQLDKVFQTQSKQI